MTYGINDYLLFSILGVVLALFLVGAARLYYGKGLGFKVFAVVIPALDICGIAGFIIGKSGFDVVVFTLAVSIAVSTSLIAIVLLNNMVLKRYRQQIDDLMSSVSQISSAAKQTAATAAEQADAVAQVSTTIEELQQMSQNASQSAEKVLKSVTEATDKGMEGVQKISEASDIMQAIGQVRGIVETVNDLAEQSNLLAVNASIEAAKVGEYGRGFSVVATEVRQLAEQSKEATVAIREAISRTDEGRESINVVQRVIDEMAKVQESTSDDARQISGVTHQQSAGIRQITEAMINLSDGGRQAESAAIQLAQAVGNLTTLGNDLQLFVTGSHTST